jgi:predicted transcriptional regulator YdeE
MAYTLEQHPSKTLIGIQVRTGYDTFCKKCPQHWNKFFTEKVLQKIPNKVSDTVYAVYTDYEGDYTGDYTYIIGCEVSTLGEIPEGFVSKTIPKTTYAVYKAEGAFPKSVENVWGHIWNSGLKRAYTSDFEIYRTTFDPVKNPEVLIYIAL